MRPTEIISLAQAIVNAKSKDEQSKLHNSCPEHLRALLISNIRYIRSLKKRQKKSVKDFTPRAIPKPNPYARRLPKSHNKPVVQQVGLANVQMLREKLGVEHVSV